MERIGYERHSANGRIRACDLVLAGLVVRSTYFKVWDLSSGHQVQQDTREANEAYYQSLVVKGKKAILIRVDVEETIVETNSEVKL